MSNIPSSSKGDADDNPSDIQSFSDQLRAIQGRIEKTDIVNKSLQSTEHELKLHLQALASRSKTGPNPVEDAQTAELNNRIQALSRQADELTKDSNLISRRTGVGADSVSKPEKKKKTSFSSFIFMLTLYSLYLADP